MSALSRAQAAPVNLTYWARSVRSDVTIETGLGPQRHKLPAINPDSRKVLVEICAGKAPFPDEHGLVEILRPFEALKQATGFSAQRIANLLGFLRRCGVVRATPVIVDQDGTGMLRVLLKVEERSHTTY